MVVCTHEFAPLARMVARGQGMEGLPLALVDHPVGDQPPEVVAGRARSAVEQVKAALLSTSARAAGQGAGLAAPRQPGEASPRSAAGKRELTLRSERYPVENSPEAVDRLFYDRGWGDGLPLVPPTEARVRAVLAYSDRPPDAVLGAMAPGFGVVTIEKLAINAVMAGCLPAYFPVVVTAVEALLDERFNLHSIQTTTHPAAPLLLLNGPIAAELEVNGGCNALGQGCRANATIGRAIRLILVNVGGGVPGEMDRSTLGHPGKFSFCLRENEAASPWEPFHVARGFDPAASTVTVLGVEGPHNINDHGSTTGEGLLKTVISTMSTAGSNHHRFPRGEPLVLFGPEHAALLARDGFTRRKLQETFLERAVVPMSHFSRELITRNLARRRPKWFGPENGGDFAALADQPEDFLIAVAGGAGKHTAFLPSFGGTLGVTLPIRLANGVMARSVEDFRG